MNVIDEQGNQANDEPVDRGVVGRRPFETLLPTTLTFELTPPSNHGVRYARDL
jgi:hypothetical protein